METQYIEKLNTVLERYEYLNKSLKANNNRLNKLKSDVISNNNAINDFNNKQKILSSNIAFLKKANLFLSFFAG